jgi:hypothetical protein
MPPTDLPPLSGNPTSPPRRDADHENAGDRHTSVAGLMAGTALMFIGFLNIFLSISGGFEINVVPFLIYFGGLAVWANSVIENPTLRYSIIATAVLLALVFFHFGEVLFWHKQVVFWVTIAMVVYFMFKTSTPSRR